METCTAEEIPLKITEGELTIMPYGVESLYLTF